MSLRDLILGGLAGGGTATAVALSGGADHPTIYPEVPAVEEHHVFCDGHPGWTDNVARHGDTVVYSCTKTVDGVEYIMYLNEDGTPNYGDDIGVPGPFLLPEAVPTWDAP
jgi:hypothetical protein